MCFYSSLEIWKWVTILYDLIQSFLIFYYSLRGKRDGCMGKPWLAGWLAGWCCKRRSVKNKSLTWCIKSTRNCGCLICDGLSFLISTKQDQPACLEPHHILTQIRLILTALELLCQCTNTHTPKCTYTHCDHMQLGVHQQRELIFKPLFATILRCVYSLALKSSAAQGFKTFCIFILVILQL